MKLHQRCLHKTHSATYMSRACHIIHSKCSICLQDLWHRPSDEVLVLDVESPVSIEDVHIFASHRRIRVVVTLQSNQLVKDMAHNQKAGAVVIVAVPSYRTGCYN